MIIGICGLAGSGKDTIADWLCNDYSFQKISLADPIKRMCKDVFEFTDQQLWGPSQYRNAPDDRYNGLTPRYALQRLGTEWGRDCYNDIWIDLAIRNSKKALNGEGVYSIKNGFLDEKPDTIPTGMVIPDVRFENEISKIQENNGLVIRVLRNDAGLSGQAANHVSETEMQKIPDFVFDYIIYNNKDLAYAKRCLEEIMEDIISKE